MIGHVLITNSDFWASTGANTPETMFPSVTRGSWTQGRSAEGMTRRFPALFGLRMRRSFRSSNTTAHAIRSGRVCRMPSSKGAGRASHSVQQSVAARLQERVTLFTRNCRSICQTNNGSRIAGRFYASAAPRGVPSRHEKPVLHSSQRSFSNALQFPFDPDVPIDNLERKESLIRGIRNATSFFKYDHDDQAHWVGRPQRAPVHAVHSTKR